MTLRNMARMKPYIYKYALSFLFSIGCFLTSLAQHTQNWAVEETAYRGNYFLTDQAIQTADHVLLYQLPDGGWPKGIYYPAPLSAVETANISIAKSHLSSCLSGRSTLAEIHFLSNMYQNSARRKYKKAAEDGISFLIQSQFDNGGWPLQVGESHPIISLSDNSFIEIMTQIWRIAEGKTPYDYVSADLRKKCSDAFNNGINFILRTQCFQNGKPAIWFSCYDAQTLQPMAGSQQELLALNTQISDNLTSLLMSLSNPPELVTQAIEGAVNWYKENKISGLTRQNFVNKQGKRDFRFVEDKHAPDMWALYYDPATNKPVFCETDGSIIPALDDLTYEARKSMSWYNNDGGKLIRNYQKWKDSK